MRIGKLKQAWTIMQVLYVLDEHKQDYIDQHDYYRIGDFENVRGHIERQFSAAMRAGEDADKCLNQAKQRVVSALGGTQKQYMAFS